MKKKWLIKYVVALVLGVAMIFILGHFFKNVNGQYMWYCYLAPVVTLSLIMVWKVIQRYIVLALDKVDVGDSAYNVLFKCLLVLCGFLLLIPLLLIGVVLVVLNFIKEYTVFHDEYVESLKEKGVSKKRYQKPSSSILKNSRRNKRIMEKAGVLGSSADPVLDKTEESRSLTNSLISDKSR